MLHSTGKPVSHGSCEGYRFRTVEIDGFRVHDIEVVGPIDLATRIPLYRETLRHTIPPFYFCIVDNAEGFENDFSYDDMQLLDRMLIEHGITTFFGATITRDAAYAKLIKLAQTNMEEAGLQGAVIEVPDRTAAVSFILERIRDAAS